nr:hypothetical protein CFP56_76994 [Quercus suber]
MDPVASRLSLLSGQGFPESRGREQMERESPSRLERGRVCGAALHLLAHHVGHFAFAELGGQVLPTGYGQRLAVVRLLLLRRAVDHSLAFLRVSTGNTQHRTDEEDHRRVG